MQTKTRMATIFPLVQANCRMDLISNSVLNKDIRANLLENQSSPFVKSNLKKFRAIAPRPTVPSMDSSSPSSSVDNNSQPSSPVAVSKVKKGRKRLAPSASPSLPLEKRPIQKRLAPDPSLSLPQGDPQTQMSINICDKLSALDGTPLGKLLRATPDIKIPSDTVTRTCTLHPEPNLSGQSSFPAISNCLGNTGDAGGHAADSSQSPGPVTLPLLPDVPCNLGSRDECSKLKTSLSKYLSMPSTDDGSCNGVLPLKSTAPSHSSASSSHKDRSTLIDSDYMDRKYGSSKDFMLLTEEGGEILWKSQGLRSMREPDLTHFLMTSPRSLIDKLNFFSPSKARFCNAILWNISHDPINDAFRMPFSKFVEQSPMQEKSAATAVDFGNVPLFRGVQCSLSQTPNAITAANDTSTSMNGPLPSLSLFSNSQDSRNSPVGLETAKVFRPKALRLMRSLIKVREVCTIGCTPIKGSFDSMKIQTEQWNVPVVLTDSSFKVRWVNASYKSMLNDCISSVYPKPSSALYATNDGSDKNGVDYSNPISSSVGSVEMRGMESFSPISTSPSAISCIATVEWTKDGDSGISKFAGSGTKLEDADSKPVGYVWCLYTLPKMLS